MTQYCLFLPFNAILFGFIFVIAHEGLSAEIFSSYKATNPNRKRLVREGMNESQIILQNTTNDVTPLHHANSLR
jgi:hypothetical protein